MLCKTFVSLLAASATVLAISLPGEDDDSSSVQRNGAGIADPSSCNDDGYGNTRTRTVTVTENGRTQWTTRTVWSTTTSTRRAVTSTTTIRAAPVTRTTTIRADPVTRTTTTTIRADPVTSTITVGAAPAASTPQILNVRLHPTTNCASNGVRGEGRQVEYSELAIPFPFARTGRGGQTRESQCFNTPNDFFSLSFESFFGRRGLSGCSVQLYDDQNCQRGRLLRSVGVGNNERECYPTSAGGRNDGRTGERDNVGGNGGKNKGNKRNGAQSLRLVCRN